MESREIVQGYVLSAIDMEERFARGVYIDYMDRKNWPVDVDSETFEKILVLLKILVDDTARHKEILGKLKKRLA